MKQILIERSVWFEEPLQEVELVEENFAKIPSCSVDNLNDENESEGYDITNQMYGIANQMYDIADQMLSTLMRIIDKYLYLFI